MFDLKDLITKYPECMDNRTKFCSYIYDLYPETSKAFVGVLGDILDCGIAKELKDAGGKLDPLTMASYQARLNATKVYSTKAVIEGIKLWAQAFREESEVQTSDDNKAPKTNSKHVHKYRTEC
ncbi:MAG: hypothetical protein MJ137_07900 [Clostridia bacterium]|nr:hypothetical protein [Clostridia bacterium]